METESFLLTVMKLDVSIEFEIFVVVTHSGILKSSHYICDLFAFEKPMVQI